MRHTRTSGAAGLSCGMPIVSVFFGITIRMYFGDHPPPHIHAAYQGQAALISIETGKVLRGSLRSRALRLVQEWIMIHRSRILGNWERCEALEPLERIPGLDDE